jgi:hypothetical protein
MEDWWNSGITAVHIPPKIFVQRGTKPVGGMSAEWGQNVTDLVILSHSCLSSCKFQATYRVSQKMCTHFRC